MISWSGEETEWPSFVLRSPYHLKIPQRSVPLAKSKISLTAWFSEPIFHLFSDTLFPANGKTAILARNIASHRVRMWCDSSFTLGDNQYRLLLWLERQVNIFCLSIISLIAHQVFQVFKFFGIKCSLCFNLGHKLYPPNLFKIRSAVIEQQIYNHLNFRILL